MVRRPLLIAIGLLVLAGGAAAQTPPAGERREPARASSPAAAAQRGAEQRRQAEPRRPAAGQRSAGQSRAQPAGERPARPGAGGSLNLDLNVTRAQTPTVQQRPGDAFSASGPYASQSQMQRYTGRRSIQLPQAPVQVFGNSQQQTIQNPFQPY